ncbi:MAG: hypothetical protein OXK78_15410 [Caldilineaceae bacterium]|nr:hypothetical protein [Caldilineaceae bacterium]
MAAFWASVPVHVLLGFAAAIPVILWDWRIALPGILLVQLGTSVLTGTVYGLAAPWPTVHFGVQALGCLILLLSILQTSNVQVRTSGEFSSRLFRMLILGIAALLVWRATEGIDLPRLDDATKVLFIWFAAVALITLGMTETALFGSIGILMWLIPVQAFMSVLFPLPAVIVLLGILQILVALACSFLLLAEDDALTLIEVPSTDPDLAPGVHRRHSIASGARVLGYGIGYWFYTLVNRRRNTEARNG